ncbi:TolC family protein [Prevotella sp. 10(H)]|uniref:TolC family protein n=1 Tax=Prevotella sp. 10(H) TaxID=1158294 RepID=UPI0004A6F7CC|nr:TolC family protein [Prevotella sp. 10(H)]
MRKFLLFTAFFYHAFTGFSQEPQIVRLDSEQIQSLFLTNNLELIVSRYNIDISDAAVTQAKLWNNPTLSVSNVNLWSTGKQREELSEIASYTFAKNTEFSIELSQLIQTANKRGKLIRREKVSKEIALHEFEEVMRGLKAELRKSVCEIQYSQSYLKVLNNQHESLFQLIESYKKQVQQGNIAKNELLRLQSSLLELENEINETREEFIEKAKTLKVLLNLSPLTEIEITANQKTNKAPDALILSELFIKAEESRPDMKVYNLQTQFFKKSLDYEKSLRVPDITISAAYDRYGGVWKDFIGLGVSIDLPFFNRNQGNIKAAKISMKQNSYITQHQMNIIHHEISASYNNYINAYSFYKRINEESLLPELDDMLSAYTKNLMNRNISMLEYIDFMEAYKTNKQTMLNARKKMNIQFEELQYTVGTDIK